MGVGVKYFSCSSILSKGVIMFKFSNVIVLILMADKQPLVFIN